MAKEPEWRIGQDNTYNAMSEPEKLEYIIANAKRITGTMYTLYRRTTFNKNRFKELRERIKEDYPKWQTALQQLEGDRRITDLDKLDIEQ